MTAARYSNAMARLVLGPMFRDQWAIPEAPPRLERFLRWYERRFLPRDVDEVRVDRPILFVSLPRCGSSMLQDVLCAHPRAAYVTNTMHQFRSCFRAAEHLRRRLSLDVRGERFLGDSVEVSAGGPADPVGTWAEWLGQDPFSTRYVRLDRARLPPGAAERIRSDIERMIRCFGGGRRRFVCKTPALLPHVELLAELFPDAKFIHLVRDPRPSANSMVKLYRRCQAQLEAIDRRRGRASSRRFVPYPRLPALEDYLERYGPDDIRTAAHVWDDGVRFVDARKDRLGSFHEVRYEDVVRRPREEIRRLLEFCELPWDEAHGGALLDRLRGVGVVRHANDYGSYDVIEAICAETMARHGYR